MLRLFRRRVSYVHGDDLFVVSATTKKTFSKHIGLGRQRRDNNQLRQELPKENVKVCINEL